MRKQPHDTTMTSVSRPRQHPQRTPNADTYQRRHHPSAHRCWRRRSTAQRRWSAIVTAGRQKCIRRTETSRRMQCQCYTNTLPRTHTTTPYPLICHYAGALRETRSLTNTAPATTLVVLPLVLPTAPRVCCCSGSGCSGRPDRHDDSPSHAKDTRGSGTCTAQSCTNKALTYAHHHRAT